MSEAHPGSPTAGEMLRAAREKQGLHIAALAAAIKVAPRKLDALERDRLEELPDATFARALAQTVCRSLKIDPRPVLERLPQAHTLALEGSAGSLNAPFRERRSGAAAAVAAVRPLVWAAGALMLAALVVYLLPPGLWTLRGPGRTPVASAPAPAPAPAAASAVASALPASDAASAGEAASAPPAEVAPAVAAAAPPAPEATAAPLRLRTSRPSWVEVRDADGRVLVSRVVEPGEAIDLDGKLPFRMTIGNVAATELMLRGKVVDLARYAHDNVARFVLP